MNEKPEITVSSEGKNLDIKRISGNVPIVVTFQDYTDVYEEHTDIDDYGEEFTETVVTLEGEGKPIDITIVKNSLGYEVIHDALKNPPQDTDVVVTILHTDGVRETWL